MKNANTFNEYREMARLCLDCIYGNTARPEHKGLAYECVKKVVEADCPFWKIYQAELHACKTSASAGV